MKQNKAFTLAEVLIVLMVIGAIAGLTLPNLMKGINAAQWKTGYQKAYTAVSNIAATEKVGGQLPTEANNDSAVNFFATLSQNLSIKEYSTLGNVTTLLATSGNDATKKPYAGVTWGGSSFGDVSQDAGEAGTGANSITAPGTFSPWMIAEDGIAYAVTIGTKDNSCYTKSKLNNVNIIDNVSDLIDHSCLVILVDTNGLYKGPNSLEPQVGTGLTASTKMNGLEGDRFYIFLGSDGVAAGPKDISVAARIVEGLK